MKKYELKIQAAAEILGVSDSRISQLVADGTLESTTINGRRRISKESVEYYRDFIRRTGRPPKKKPLASDYVLMNGNYEVLRLSYDSSDDDSFSVMEVLDAARAPWGTVTRTNRGKKREFNAWWRSRAVPDARPGMDSKLVALQMGSTFEIPFKNLGLSLSDCYWIRPTQDVMAVSWEDINYFNNSFDEGRGETWDNWLSGIGLDSPDNTSEGLLPKKWGIAGGKRVLYKGCRTDDQRPYNEVVATALYARLLQAGEFVPYEACVLVDGPACVCENFLNGEEEYIPASYVKNTISNIKGTSHYDRFCKYMGRLGMNEGAAREQMSKMFVCDALLANSDRHWRNFGFIRNIETLEMRLAPLFDTGNCLWYDRSENEIAYKNWGYAAKPFGPEPERQLALVESASWFSADALDGFTEEACAILSASAHASARLDFIEEGLNRQIEKISQLMAVLMYRE